ncbi:EAL domain-containing protein [Shewanella youngdeokensis]|uniref:EAL domain-containing protein n=1 Tax=Shewanella youngdeokensis TaxID=2999068 RepID=A0ABZ0JY39_9GAMM|nr:EAL domain-containing protein [Shewanella sp. DAU334]
MLSRFSLKRKLLLFAALPMLILAMFTVQHSITLYKHYQKTSTNALTTQVVSGIENVIFELQKERGLSAGFLSSNGKKFSAELQQQWRKTDAVIIKLISNAQLNQIIEATRNDHQLFDVQQERLEQTSIERQRLAMARKRILAYDNSQFFNYYSQLNRKLISFISRLHFESDNPYQATVLDDLVNVLEIQELAGQERALINQLLAAPTVDLKSFDSISSITKQLGDIINTATPVMTKENRAKFSAFWLSPEQQEINTLRDKLQQQIDLIEQAYLISQQMGSDPLSNHANDNSIIKDIQNTVNFEHHYFERKIALANIKNGQVLNPEQHQLIATIEHTIDSYYQYVQHTKSSDQPSPLASQLADNNVQMHQALQQLQNQPPQISSAYWWSAATANLALSHNISIELIEKIALQSEVERQQILSYVYISILAGVLFFCVVYFLGQYITNSLLDSITTIVDDVEKMAKDPNLQLQIKVKGNDELAQISTALNLMLNERLIARQSLLQASAVFEHSSEGIMVTDANNRIELVNPAFSRITGYTIDEVKGQKPSILSSNNHGPEFYIDLWQSLKHTNNWEGEIWNKRKDGSIYPEYLSITAVKDEQDNICQHIGLFLDVSNRKQHEQDLWYKTNFDSLTKLPKRHLFSSQLQQAIDSASQHQAQVAVFIIDLDRFKFINELHGHAIGNEIIKQSAARIEAALKPEDLVARLDGDEFAIASPLHHADHTAKVLAQKLTEVLTQPISIDTLESSISASIGVAFYPEDGQDIETLLRNAETAMYQAKHDGRAHFQYFAPEMNVEMLARVQLEHRLRKAVIKSEFYLDYQPIIDMQTGAVSSVEALIRWRDPELGIVSPELFIPIAEETGLIEPLGEWILNQALADLAQWHAQGHLLNLAINVSGRQCIHPTGSDFYQLLRSALTRHNIAPNYLHIEITESMLIDDTPHCLKALKAIRELGIDIYLDDFGTGYSALSYLSQFPISVIKIDKSFIDNATSNQSDAKLVKAIIMMGQSLELPLVAEGIETEAQWQFLQALGCHYAQGYLMSKPLSNHNLIAFLNNETAINRIVNRKALSA